MQFPLFYVPSLSPADSLPDRPVSQYLICMLPRIRHIKFRILPERLLGRAPHAWIATGHYARLLPSPLNASVPALYRGNNIRKDQSHYLSTSPLSALQRTLFPLGNFASKDAVRDLARRWGMHTGDKKDSMGICFVGVRKGFSSFLGVSLLGPCDPSGTRRK